MSLALFCVSLDFFALNLALPDMAADLHVAAGGLQWALSGYMLASGALMTAAGRLGDLFGHRRLLLFGVGLFGASSLMCGLSGSATELVAFRVLQGAGVAFVMPVGLALLTHVFDEDRRAKANGFVFGVAGVGLVLGPFVGGLLTQTVGWRSVFWLNVPFTVLSLVLASRVQLKHDASSARAVDWPGLVTVTAAIASLTVALDRGRAWGWTSGRTLGLLAAGVLLLAVFVAVESKVARPLVDLALFRNRMFVIITAGGAVASAAASVYLFGASLYLQEVRHFPAGTAGLVLLVPAVATAAAGPLAGRLGGIAPLKVMAGAGAVGGLAVLGLGLTSWLPLYVLFLAVCGGALKLSNTFTVIATQGVIRPERAGEASGVTLTAIVTAGGVGIALAGSALGAQGVTTSAVRSTLVATAVVCLVSAGILVAARLHQAHRAARTLPEAVAPVQG
ncbi:MFS transporter [Streptomyces sp. WAC06614]|uniref:MFS transporter n=1 Tax=Streptomyces sp. WAC06614 TaxID=2487416 RepID=UPI00163B9A78|nr:MFS transporter [Streptomyces sp. WAC06614]